VDVTVADNFLGLDDEESSYQHGRLLNVYGATSVFNFLKRSDVNCAYTLFDLAQEHCIAVCGTTGATRGCRKVSHVVLFRRLISRFVFDILHPDL
jgi:hypothetical protein